MADRYWRGGSGTWDTTNTSVWSETSGGATGASVPTASDNVFFDVNSANGNYTITMLPGGTCLNLTVSTYAPAFSTGISGTLTIYGSMSVTSNTEFLGDTGVLTFAATTSQTIRSNFISCIWEVVFNGVGGEWSLLSDFTTNATTTNSPTTLTAGTLNLNGFNISVSVFVSLGTNTRAINFGANFMFFSVTLAAQGNVNMGTAAGFSCSGTGGFSAAANITRTFDIGTTSAPTVAPNLFLTGSGTAVQTISTTSRFGTLDYGTTAFTTSGRTLNVSNVVLSPSGTYTALTLVTIGTGSVTTNGKTITGLTINHTGTTTLTGTVTTSADLGLTSGTLNLNGFNVTCRNFSSFNTNTRSLNFGANFIFLTNTTAAQTNLQLDCANFTPTGAGGFSTIMSTTRTFTCTGSGAANAPNMFFTSGASVITFFNTPTFNVLDFGTCTSTFDTADVVACRSITSVSGAINGNNLRVCMYGTATLGVTGMNHLQINDASYTPAPLPQDGTTTLSRAVNLALSSSVVTHNGGTLDLNGFDILTGRYVSSYIAGISRTINFGANFINTNNPNNVILVDLQNATDFSAIGTGGFTKLNNPTANQTFNVGTSAGTPQPLIAPNVKINGGSFSIGCAGYFNTVDYSQQNNSSLTQGGAFNCKNLLLGTGVNLLYTTMSPTMDGTGSITSNGKTIGGLTINHTGTTTLNGTLTVGTTNATTTLTSGTLALNGFNLSTGIFSSTGTNTRSVTFGNNFIFITASSAGVISVDMPNATNFSTSGAGGLSAIMSRTRTFTVGTTGAPTVAPNLFITSGASVPTLTTGSYFGNLDFTGSTCIPATTSLNLTGLVLASGGTYTGLTATMVGSGTINGNGKTIPALTINQANLPSTTTFGGSLTTSTSTTLTQGTIDLAGNTLTTASFLSTGPTTRSITNSVGTGIIANSGDWTVTNGTGFTGSGYNINMTKATAKAFAGGGGTYGTLVQAGAGALTISGNNTFADIQATTRPSTITYTAGTTQTLADFTLSGTVGNFVTINSTVAGTQFTMTKPSGTISVNYLNIQDSNVTGGAYWGTTTSNFISNNTGWNMVSSAINGQFMAFF